jgi:hypothetical protein
VLAPNLVGAVVLLLAGYVLGKTAATITRRVLARLGADRLAESSGLAAFTRQWGLERPLSALIGSVAFAFILLAFAISAADALGLAAAGQAVAQVMLFLPKFVAATAVLLLSLMAASWLAGLVRRAADNAGFEYAPTLGRITMGVLAALVALMAVDQLDIRIVLLQEVISIALAALGVAVALSLGLGTRGLSSEIVSGVYVRDWLREGDRIEWNGQRATVREVGTLKTLLALDVTLASEPGKNERSADCSDPPQTAWIVFIRPTSRDNMNTAVHAMESFMADLGSSVENVAEDLAVTRDGYFAWISKRYMPTYRATRFWKFEGRRALRLAVLRPGIGVSRRGRSSVTASGIEVPSSPGPTSPGDENDQVGLHRFVLWSGRAHTRLDLGRRAGRGRHRRRSGLPPSVRNEQRRAVHRGRRFEDEASGSG